MPNSFTETLWYRQHPLRWFLWPFAIIFQIIAKLRRFFLEHFCQQACTVPLIAVGNLTVGGVGKTPLVIALTKACQERGLRVGIVSRGFGANIRTFPYMVTPQDSAEKVGDEPLLLAQKTGAPVVIAPRRMQAVQYLIEHYDSQIIISDDGLQHYRMGRSIEIVVIDGIRGLGNGLCLPAGPLREGQSRLTEVDFIVVNGASTLYEDWPETLKRKVFTLSLEPGKITGLLTGQEVTPAQLPSPLAAIAGIGHPQRFFATLTSLGLRFKPYPFRDHYVFREKDLIFSEKGIVMTEKDAVKCLAFATDTMYFLPVEACLSAAFWSLFWSNEHLQGHF